jgi:uncharacterized protein YqeY
MARAAECRCYAARMSIKDKISEDLKAAMRARDSVRLDAIRAIRAAITLREVEKQKELNDDEVIELVRTLRKQKLEAIEMFGAGGRADLVERETSEKAVLESYLPQAPSRELVEQTIAQIISELGVTTVKDMGRVMAASKERLSGADGKLVSEVVRAQLAQK